MNCARGMMSLVLDPESVRLLERIEIKAAGRDMESLLVSWLEEILYRVEAGGTVFGEFGIEGIEGTVASGWGWGEPLDPRKHDIRLEIKAPTYHMLELKEGEGRWTARIIFDV